MTISPAQFRMAKAALQASTTEISAKTGLNKNTINKAGNDGATLNASTIATLKRFFEDRGAVFLQESDTEGPGIRLGKREG